VTNGANSLSLRAKYATVKIPLELAAKLDKFVADMGYRSRAEIVNDAIRRFIDDQKRLNGSAAEPEESKSVLQVSR
jgi:metal-responsive CopG/Arc/MetJ family transcriptional regulator